MGTGSGSHLSVSNFASVCDHRYLSGPMVDSGSVYCKTDYVISCLNDIRDRPGPFVLVTSGSDYAITDVHAQYIPDNLTRWFAVNCELEHKRVEGIPLGMAPEDHPLGDWDIIANERSSFSIRDTLCHMCFALDTHPDRNIVHNQFRNKRWVWDETFVPRKPKPLGLATYLANLHRCHYCISPRGNGPDTHRTWESIYLGTIPIVKREPATRWFEKHYPILFIDDWSQVTEEFLRDHNQQKIGKRYTPKMWMPYWSDKFSREN